MNLRTSNLRGRRGVLWSGKNATCIFAGRRAKFRVTARYRSQYFVDFLRRHFRFAWQPQWFVMVGKRTLSFWHDFGNARCFCLLGMTFVRLSLGGGFGWGVWGAQLMFSTCRSGNSLQESMVVLLLCFATHFWYHALDSWLMLHDNDAPLLTCWCSVWIC